jgi:hypothetical protein
LGGPVHPLYGQCRSGVSTSHEEPAPVSGTPSWQSIDPWIILSVVHGIKPIVADPKALISCPPQILPSDLILFPMLLCDRYDWNERQKMSLAYAPSDSW